MRTRFLPEFFNSATSQSLQTLDFLRFPPPQLPSSDPHNFDDLCCFDQISSLNVAPEIERFSVNEALNKFFADVLPQRINVNMDREIADYVTSEVLDDVLCDENGEKYLENPHNIFYRAGDANFSSVKIDKGMDVLGNTYFAIFQFETPQLHISTEDACFLHEPKMQIFFEVADAEISLDLLNFSLGTQHLIEVQKSVFSVDYISLEYQEEQRPDILEDGWSAQAQIPSKLKTFPLMEVDETSLGIKNCISEEDELIIFESIEPQPWTQKHEVIGDAKALLPSLEFDISQHLLSYCLVPCLKVEASADFVPEADIINAIEHSMTDGKQEWLVDEYSTLTPSPIGFELFQLFDLNVSHFSEVFSDVETVTVVEFCEGMFGETTALGTFSDLIVPHELTLRDDSFKSLPVPILSDHEKTLSVQAIVEEILAELKLQPSSTSDGIYLDWHLLEEDICSHSIHNSLKMFEEVDTYCIDADMNSCDSGILVLEFVLSDAGLYGLNVKEDMELLDIQIDASSSDIPINSFFHDEVNSNKLWNDTCQKRVDGEALLDLSARNAPQFVDSMSQFNDLHFFLNPLEAIDMKRQNPADKKSEMADAFALVSSKGSIEACGATETQWQNLDIELRPVKFSVFNVSGFSSTHLFFTEELYTHMPYCMSEDPHSAVLPNESGKNSEHSVPVDKKNSKESPEATWKLPLPQVPSALESMKISTGTPFSDAVIIVNTQNVDTEMIISRRSTYQRILAMEEGGVQVVERDLNFPVDVIVSAAVCLVWYDSTNIRRKTTASDNASSFLPSCVENIAANVLTSLSFAFSSCVLIFEGEISFLTGIMESSEEMYAAAASLGMDLQLFCSYSSETTDEIILNCIMRAAKLTRGLYPKMLESETLAESFLTKFPSINPLSAHAILSSLGTLSEFFEMSHQQRVNAVQKYLVPEVSVTLFSALCRYGEREDSRSGMTECSSSVSSGHESGSCPKSDNENRKRKYIGSTGKRGMPMDDLFQPEQNVDGTLTPNKPVNSGRYWKFGGQEKVDIGKSDMAFVEIGFGKSQATNPNFMNPPSLANQWGFQISSVPEVSGGNELHNFLATETTFSHSKRACMPIRNKLDNCTYKESRSLQQGFIGEVIDIDDDDDAMASKDYSFPPSVSFTREMKKENAPGIRGATRKLASGQCSLPSFPTAAEISSGLDSWIPTKDNGQSSRAGVSLNSHTDFLNNSTPLEHQQMFLEEYLKVNSETKSCRPSEEKDSPYGKTPLSKAISSSQPQRGSPWTIEFLNRIKEKSKLRQQSLPGISSAPCFGYSGNSSKFRKRKSPSVLDFYRYQRSSTPLQNMEHKKQKIPTQPSSLSKAVKTSPPSLRSLTPTDKRAKRRLTFATNGSKGQSKLIWSDKTDQTLNRIL